MSPMKKKQFVKMNIHNHSPTCRKNRKKICRFDFPIAPMKETRILQPLKGNKKDLKEDVARYKRIRDLLKRYGHINFIITIPQYF